MFHTPRPGFKLTLQQLMQCTDYPPGLITLFFSKMMLTIPSREHVIIPRTENTIKCELCCYFILRLNAS